MMLTKMNAEAIPVDQHPAVVAVRKSLEPVQAECQALRSDELRLMRIIEPVVSAATSGPMSLPEDIFEAEAALPEVRTKLRQALAKSTRLGKAVVAAEAEAKRDLDEARREPRKLVVQQVFEAFLHAVEAQEKLLSFDQESRAMGGADVTLPCPGLLREAYEFQRQMAERDGWC